MHYESIAPSTALKNHVKEFWVYENEDATTYRQKIIPDGYSEIIIHYGDPYAINLKGKWEKQEKLLFSNQISSFFYLENTGKSGMLGIKLFPTAFHELFDINMEALTDKVIPLNKIIPNQINELASLINPSCSTEERISTTEKWLGNQARKNLAKVRNAVNSILDSNGIIDIEELAITNGISTRQLERSFKKSIGLSPKFYARIIRFSQVFKHLETQDTSWVKVALQSGYFDQSHFIKNFKEFTGEEPSKYGFNEMNLANFFLKR